MAGKDYRVFISDDGTGAGDKVEIEFQGDLTVNEGRTLNRTAYKNGSKTAQGSDGWSANFQFGPAEPLPEGQQLLFTAYDAGGSAYVWIETATSGGMSWSGPMKVNLTEIAFPTSGEPTTQVELSEDGVISRGTVGAS